MKTSDIILADLRLHPDSRLKEIWERTGLKKSTVVNSLRTMTDRELVTRSGYLYSEKSGPGPEQSPEQSPVLGTKSPDFPEKSGLKSPVHTPWPSRLRSSLSGLA